MSSNVKIRGPPSDVASGLKCIDPENPELKKALIEQFCDLYDKLNELRKVFCGISYG